MKSLPHQVIKQWRRMSSSQMHWIIYKTNLIVSTIVFALNVKAIEEKEKKTVQLHTLQVFSKTKTTSFRKLLVRLKLKFLWNFSCLLLLPSSNTNNTALLIVSYRWTSILFQSLRFFSKEIARIMNADAHLCFIIENLHQRLERNQKGNANAMEWKPCKWSMAFNKFS